MSAVVSFGAGVLFAIGLVLSGMTEPARIVRFLDVTGEWDPSLAFVMGGAILVYAPLYRLITGRLRRPLLDAAFHIPPRGPLDLRLFTGAALFGIGWGLVGLCPGPALVALGAGKREAMLFAAAMVAGSLLGSWFARVKELQGGEVGQAPLVQDDG